MGTLQVPHSPHCSSSHPTDPAGTWLCSPRQQGESPGRACPAKPPSGAALWELVPGQSRHSLLTESCISRLEKPAVLVAVQK